jgi:DNA helicase-2/ATP-dependent DNA helicase PcrA
MAGLMRPEDAVLQGLNPAQREAVLHRGSPLLVVAGAGSGKTRVVTRRIAHLVATGASPYSILAVTFTNKAAGEMRERVAELLGESAPVWVSTFHSMAARILRREDGGLRRTRDFTIYDGDDQMRTVKAVLKDLRLDDDEFTPRAVLSRVERWKSEGRSPENVPAREHRDRRMAECYRLYEEKLSAANALDFTDLLAELLRLLCERREVREKYRRRFEHLLIDEYQDTNEVQYRIAQRLAGDGRGLCAVGDPDQSIYGWRGARIQNILDFEKKFPGTRVIRLEQNYRSTSPILSAAGAVISRNRKRIERSLRTSRQAGRRVQLLTALDEQHEAEEVCARISEMAGKGRPYSDVAVFYRTNAQSRAFEEAFLRNAIPYLLVSGTAFYQRAEVKDALAYLRLAVNPRDEISFRRAVNQPPRGVGAGALARLESAARARGLALMDAAGRPECREPLSGRARKGLEAFAGMVAGVGGPETYPVEPAVRTLLEASGLVKRFRDLKEDERVENLEELAAAAGEYDFVNPDGSLSGFLEQVALVADIDNWDGKAERVSLMTLHAAKGLEFAVVFVTGLEEGLLPHFRNVEDADGDVEEERRLFYVGMTRAKDELTLSLARSRRRYGPSQAAKASRFVGELPAGEIEPPGAVERARTSYVQAVASDEWEQPRRGRRGGRRSGAGRVPSVPRDPVTDEDGRYYEEAALAAARAEDLDLGEGDLVLHPKFGRGRVEELEGYGETARITVRFSGYGRKKLVAAYAKLERIGE